MLKINFVLLVIFTGLELASPCQLNIQNPLPVFAKKFGSKKIVFKPHGASMQLQKDESIMAYCNTGIMFKMVDSIPKYVQPGRFRSAYDYDSSNTVIEQSLGLNTTEIICDSNDKIGFKDKPKIIPKELTIFCASPSTYDLYESKNPLTNCGNNAYISYAIGVPLQTFGVENDIKVGICYDLDKIALKFASFVANANNGVIVFDEHKQTNELSIDLDERVGSLETYFQFMSPTTFNATRNTLRHTQNALFNTFEFDLASLLQDEQLNTELKDFAYIFNTMWWRQLRQQNWRYFHDALRERTQSAKYLVYTGTYGNASIPSTQGNCSSFKSDVVTVRTEEAIVTAPAYIWAYLKPLTHPDEQEFVVIAHNSPYVASPGHSEFCSVDMCDEVGWLNNSVFGNLRRLPTLGYTFCCRPEEVAKIIDYFPMAVDEIEINTSTEI